MSRLPSTRQTEGHYWGHSDALGLALSWEEGTLRFWDPASRSYLPTFEDERATRLAEASARQAADARADAADARADAEALARLAAEAEVRRLGEELRGRQTP